LAVLIVVLICVAWALGCAVTVALCMNAAAGDRHDAMRRRKPFVPGGSRVRHVS
jgi:hypothetical protein